MVLGGRSVQSVNMDHSNPVQLDIAQILFSFIPISSYYGIFYNDVVKVKLRVLHPVQQPGSYWDRLSVLPLGELKPHQSDSL